MLVSTLLILFSLCNYHQVQSLSTPSSLYCFGASSFGQLGIKLSPLSDQFVALPVAPNALKFSVISSGDMYTCGITKEFGISSSGVIYCWGIASSGQLGYGGDNDQYVPIKTLFHEINATFPATPLPTNGGFGFYNKGFTLSTSKYGSSSSGSSSFDSEYTVLNEGVHTCAISKEGIMYCWGDRNSFSNLNSSSIALIPEIVNLPRFVNATRKRSFSASGGGGGGITTETRRTSITPLSFISVSLGGGFTCAVMEVMTNSTSELISSSTSVGRRLQENVTQTSTPSSTFSPSPSSTLSISPSSSRTGTSTPTPSSSRPFAPNGICFGKRSPTGALDTLVSTQTVFASISAGLNHACGVSITGVVTCFGSGKYGQLGNGTFDDVINDEPVQVLLPAPASIVACGDTFSCALLTTFKVYCWGSNLNGRLGTGSLSDGNFSSPQKIGGPNYFYESLTVGATHTCVSSGFYTFCFGEMRNGQQGNVREVIFPPSIVQRDPLFMVPMQTDLNTGITVSSTYLDSTSSKYITQNQQDPQKIYGSTGGGNSAGSRHTCILPSDFASMGTVWCLGQGSTGALGFANSNALSTSVSSILGPISKPVIETKPSLPTISWALNSGTNVVLNVGKGSSACVLLDDQNTVECFGSREGGILGDGYLTGFVSSPKPSINGSRFISISIGKTHGCGILLFTRELWCWGTIIDKNTSTPILASSANWTSISSGDNFSCGIQSSGKGYCFGIDNSNTGRLGVDLQNLNEQGVWNTLYELKPTQWTSTSIPWQSISVGSTHSCGLANSLAYCWGDNNFGQLGNGETTRQVGFASVQGNHLWSSIVVGLSHTCAIESTDGSVYCFGSNKRGQIGITASSMNYFVPTRVVGTAITGNEILPLGDSWLTITAGDFHTCLLSSKGRLGCFGDNREGQLGTKTITNSATMSSQSFESALSSGLTNMSFVSAPAEVLAISAFGAAGAQWKAVSAGGKKTCALLTLISASPSATPSSSSSPTQTPTVSGTPSTSPILPSKTPTPSITPSRSFTSTTSAIPAGVSRSRTPTSSVTPSESPIASPPPIPFFNADISINGISSDLATNISVRNSLLVIVSTLTSVDISMVKISSIIDNSTGLLLYSIRRLDVIDRDVIDRNSRHLIGSGSSIIFKINVKTSSVASSSTSSSMSASKANLLKSYLDGSVPIPSSIQASLGGTNPLNLISTSSGVSLSSLSANVIAESIVIEQAYVAHIYPTRSSTSTPSSSPTPIITEMVGIILASSKGTSLSSFQIAGFVAAALAGVCFCAGFWLCLKLSIFDKCCCRRRVTEKQSIGVMAAGEFKGRGPIRITRRTQQARMSDVIGNSNGAIDNSDKIDSVSFNTVIVNPLHERKIKEEEEDEHDEL
jgi:alpha-tubulin suppressor-like RCC1 family protein